MIVSKKKFVSEIVKKTLGDTITFCVLSGPSFAEEITKQYPTAVVVASANHDVNHFFFNMKLFPLLKGGQAHPKNLIQQILPCLHSRGCHWSRNCRCLEKYLCFGSRNSRRFWVRI